MKIVLNERKEKKKLLEIISAMPESKQKIAEGLIDDACFMLDQLVKLKASIREDGVVEEYKNGENQYGTKLSSEFQAYVQLQKSYLNTMKQLCELLPEDEETPAGKELMEFLGKR